MVSVILLISFTIFSKRIILSDTSLASFAAWLLISLAVEVSLEISFKDWDKKTTFSEICSTLIVVCSMAAAMELTFSLVSFETCSRLTELDESITARPFISLDMKFRPDELSFKVEESLLRSIMMVWTELMNVFSISPSIPISSGLENRDRTARSPLAAWRKTCENLCIFCFSSLSKRKYRTVIIIKSETRAVKQYRTSIFLSRVIYIVISFSKTTTPSIFPLKSFNGPIKV